MPRAWSITARPANAFNLQILWWVAAVLLVLWIVGFAVRGHRPRYSRGRR